ncbi:hypothetical protein VNO78_25171 [Psophocarpus tetragonolobus]|uniref:Uncharacterized protein n=1 Tax=Psophocarpus tetragonolobus TaxID=3891 RepID=A0AAN9S5F8_PSOTE
MEGGDGNSVRQTRQQRTQSPSAVASDMKSHLYCFVASLPYLRVSLSFTSINHFFVLRARINLPRQLHNNCTTQQLPYVKFLVSLTHNRFIVLVFAGYVWLPMQQTLEFEPLSSLLASNL